MADDTGHQAVLDPPYRTVLKPYGHALVELARGRPEIVCLSGDLTRQCEINDSVLRQLFVRLPDSLVEPILAHAKGEQTAPAPDAVVEEPEAVGAGVE